MLVYFDPASLPVLKTPFPTLLIYFPVQHEVDYYMDAGAHLSKSCCVYSKNLYFTARHKVLLSFISTVSVLLVVIAKPGEGHLQITLESSREYFDDVVYRELHNKRGFLTASGKYWDIKIMGYEWPDL